MKPTRRTQPMRRGPGRRSSGALKAALRGATASGSNPMDVKRGIQKGAGKKGGKLKGRLRAATRGQAANRGAWMRGGRY